MLAKVSENLYFGSLLSVVQTVKSTKNKDDLAVLSILDEEISFKNIKNHKFIFMTDSGTNQRDFIAMPALRDGVEFIASNLQNGKTVIVHCKSGINRSSFLICGYLISKLGMNPKDAEKYIRNKRSQVKIYDILRKTLSDFHSKIQHQ